MTSPLRAHARARRAARAGLVAVVALSAVVGAAMPARAATKPANAPKTPTAWDAQVAPIAKEVERIRGLTFEHPVNVRYLDDADFEKVFDVEEGGMTAKERAATERAEAQLRAIGLIGPDVDLLAASTDLQKAGVLAYYDPDTKQVTVRGKELDAARKVTLAHELTHALDDQHFDLNKLDRAADRAHASLTLSALTEGNAVVVQQAYVGTLSARDRDQYTADQGVMSDEYQKDVDAAEIPAAVDALFATPYALGPSMVRLAEDSSDNAVNDLFANPPRSEVSFLDPVTVTDRTVPLRVVAPKLEPGEEQRGPRDSFGALALFLMLSTTMDPVDAFPVARGWGGDAMVTFARGDQTCVRAVFTGRDADGSAALGEALQRWSLDGAHPSSTVKTLGRSTTLTACDERGASIDPGNAPTVALTTAQIHSELSVALSTSTSVKVAACAADAALRQRTFIPYRDAVVAEPSSEPPSDVVSPFVREARAAVSACMKDS